MNIRALSGYKFSHKDTFSKIKNSLHLSQSNNGIYYGIWPDTTTHNKRHMNDQLNPSTGEILGQVSFGDLHDYDKAIEHMTKAKKDWMLTPAPKRGELVRQLGDKLRKHKNELGLLISLEMGKIVTEGLGEVQEAIDICDFAVGLSRSLNGAVIPSERPGHVMLERYHPLQGHVGIITAFNFPVAVYFWNLAISLVCGNTHLWKPHESLSMTSVAVTRLVSQVIEENGYPGAIASMICGKGELIGEKLVNDPGVELVSFTGSTKVGREVSATLANRFGKSILELGGNNAMVVDASADINMAVRAALFSAVGTAGQRCTTLRRLYIHQDVYHIFLDKLLAGYKSVKIGSPLDPSTLCGPLHNQQAVKLFESTVKLAKKANGKILFGGDVRYDLPGNFVTPTIIEMNECFSDELIEEERFIPVLYVKLIKSFQEGLQHNNSVTQGLSSSLFTKDTGHMFEWLGETGSDCGIVNVNIGTSGAEIGGAFGGEKATGGGRESGSDSWKQYMRRSTCTINHSDNLPLAQGVHFGD